MSLLLRSRFDPLPREFTIYPDAQGPNREPPLEVELQRSFTGPYAIPSCLADEKCNSFGVQGLCDKLNEVMGTLFPLSPSLEFHLARCISLDYDFGLAYSYLRPHWRSDFETLATRMDKAESNDASLRREALDPSKKYINNPQLPPRRVWDLFSNRVIPYYWWEGDLWRCLPVSHSWVTVDERVDIWTLINGREWPVPIPNDSNLERVRIELLNYRKANDSTRGYSWLDVLCLRQAGEELANAQRLEEWMTDVPTIGYIYNRPVYNYGVLVYFNGLGRPFCNGGYDDPRHWFSRTWTVQEAVRYPLLGGATPSSPALQRPFSSDLDAFYSHFTSAFGKDRVRFFSQYITLMRKRHATNELDRISGLASISRPQHLPIYDAKQSVEDAWAVLVKAIGEGSRAHLFFWYPGPGNAQFLWAPSWLQIMAVDVPTARGKIEGYSTIRYDETHRGFYGRGFSVVENCLVLGLDLPSLGMSSGSSVIRTGSIILGSQHIGIPRQYSVIANHQVAIDNNIRYILLFPLILSSTTGDRFVVGARNDAGEFQKLCVLDFASNEPAIELEGIRIIEDVLLT